MNPAPFKVLDEKGSHLWILHTATLIASRDVIPVKTGIQTAFLLRQETSIQESGFPRIKYGAGLVKPGMTNDIIHGWPYIKTNPVLP